MMKMKMKTIIVLVFSILVISTWLQVSHCSKKPVGVARRDDIPYIKCQVCEKLAAQLYHQVEKKQAQISPKKVILSSGFVSNLDLWYWVFFFSLNLIWSQMLLLGSDLGV